MKDSNQNHTIKCEDIQDLLIKENIENLSIEETSLLKIHIKTCKYCQKYQQDLAYFQKSIPISQTSPLKPDPAIRRLVLKRLLKRKPDQQGILNLVWQWISKILEYRIPVYQGLIGVVCGLLIFIMIRNFFILNQHESKRTIYRLQTADTTVYQINVIKNLQIIEHQKIGRSIGEDSLLTRFVVTAL